MDTGNVQMATKKKIAAPKKARRTPDPKPARAGKAKAKKPASKPKKKAAPKAPAAKKSVDSLLKSFEKERVTLGSSLSAGRKKIETMAKKIAVLKAELEETKRNVVETELAIETLDARRDKEIGTLLQGLGVDLSKAAAAAKVKPPAEKETPLFDKSKSDSQDV